MPPYRTGKCEGELVEGVGNSGGGRGGQKVEGWVREADG